MSDTFCTVADVKQYLVLGRNTTADDGVLDRLVARCTRAIQSYLSDNIFLTSYTEIRDGTGTDTLVLANSPVASVASVSVGPPLHRIALVVNSDYIVTPTALRALSQGVFPRGVANVVIVYVAGYSDVPLDIVDACAKWTALKYKQLERTGQISVTQQGQTVTFETTAMPEDVKLQLNNYARRVQLSPG